MFAVPPFPLLMSPPHTVSSLLHVSSELPSCVPRACRYRPLTHASHVAYSSLPSRPPELEGKALFGWVPEGWREENWRGHLGSEATDSMLCVVCEEGHEQAGEWVWAESAAMVFCDFLRPISISIKAVHTSCAGNLILLCDGCDAPYHMRCLSTPLRRVPSGNWYCPACKREAKVSRVAKAAQERAGTHGIEDRMSAVLPRAQVPVLHSPC